MLQFLCYVVNNTYAISAVKLKIQMIVLFEDDK